MSTCAMQMATKNMSPRCPIFCANLVAVTRGGKTEVVEGKNRSRVVGA